MKLGWLRGVWKVSKAVAVNPMVGAALPFIPGGGLVQATLGAVNAVEAVSKAKGKDKEEEAMKLVGPILALSGAAGKMLNEPEVRDAVRKVMQTYVAVDKAEDAVRDAVQAFEEAKAALERAVTG